jgi:hypothetical protein
MSIISSGEMQWSMVSKSWAPPIQDWLMQQMVKEGWVESAKAGG